MLMSSDLYNTTTSHEPCTSHGSLVSSQHDDSQIYPPMVGKEHSRVWYFFKPPNAGFECFKSHLGSATPDMLGEKNNILTYVCLWKFSLGLILKFHYSSKLCMPGVPCTNKSHKPPYKFYYSLYWERERERKGGQLNHFFFSFSKK